jgi:hypothetical protein
MWRHESWQPNDLQEPLSKEPHTVPESDLPPFPEDPSIPVSDHPLGQGDFTMEGVDTFGTVIFLLFAQITLITTHRS